MTRPAPGRPHPAQTAFAVLLALLAAASAFVVGQRTAPDRTLSDPVSIGFARDMQVHHAQAVAMSAPLHRRSDDPAVSTLAFDIMTTQQGQIGVMDGWLDLADPDDVGGEPMAWMGEAHQGHAGATGGAMPGMAAPAQVAALDRLPVDEATEQYLRLMARHHAGALPMARYAAQHAGHPDVRLLAQGMYDAQASEVQVLQDMLVERGHAPEPLDVAGQDGGHGHRG